jgi:nucleotide-binding universal stress UspA family protein
MAQLMYRHILVPLENSRYDAVILEHVRRLARWSGASLVLIHVADGFAARNIHNLNLRESEEMRKDRVYLEGIAADLANDGLTVEAVLAGGDPAREIAAAAVRERCDLIAMTTHGHKLIGDIIHGSVANSVRHISTVPVLLVREGAQADATPPTESASTGRRETS